MEKHMLITISRQFGSGGREVSKILAKKLGVRRYDKNCLGNLGDYGYERVQRHNRMYIEQAKVILGVAEKESAVFLGRCADYILRDKPNCYSFFIYADDDFRAKRAKTDYNGATIDQLNKEEKRRKQYYEFYTGQTWSAPEHYDLMINTSNMALEDVADFILDYIKKNPRG